METPQDKHIDRLFGEGLKKGREVPSEGLWDRIEAELDEEPKRIIPIWKWWSVAATIALFVSLGYIAFDQTRNHGVEDGLVEQTTGANSDGTNTSGTSNGTATDGNPSNRNDDQNSPASIDPSLGNGSHRGSGEGKLADATETSDSDAALSADQAVNPTTKVEAGQAANSRSNISVRTAVAASSNNSQTPGTDPNENADVLAVNSPKIKGSGTEGSDGAKGGTNDALAGSDAALADADASITDSKSIRPQLSRMTLATIGTFPVDRETSLEAGREEALPDDIMLAFADDNWDSDRNARQSPWSLGGYFGPGTSSAAFGGANQRSGGWSANQDEALQFNSGSSKNSVTEQSNVEFAYTSGLQFGYQLGKRFALQSGLGLSGMNGTIEEYNTTQADVATPADPGTGTGGVDSYVGVEESLPSTDTSSNRFSYRYLEIPLMLRYDIVSKRLRYYVSSGISTNMLSSFAEPDSPEGRTTTIAPAQLNVLIGTGAEYRLVRSLNLRVEPLFRYGLLSSTRSLSSNTFNNFGINTGVSFNF